MLHTSYFFFLDPKGLGSDFLTLTLGFFALKLGESESESSEDEAIDSSLSVSGFLSETNGFAREEYVAGRSRGV